MRRRTAASQTGLACETGMRRPWRFHPGRKLAPRSGFEPLSSALTVRCLAMSAIAEKFLVDPLGLEPRPDGLRDRCAAVTPRVSVGKGGGSCIPIIGFGDRGSAVELRPCESVERAARIELASSAWKTAASPFGQTRIEFGTSLMNRTSVAAVRSRSAGFQRTRCNEFLAPFPRNPTWSSLAYKASAVVSGSKGAFVTRLRCPQAIDECQPRHRRPACAYAPRPPVASLLLLASC